MYKWLRVRKYIYIEHKWLPSKTPDCNHVAHLLLSMSVCVLKRLDSDADTLHMWSMVTIQFKCTSWPPQRNVSSAFRLLLNAARTTCQGL